MWRGGGVRGGVVALGVRHSQVQKLALVPDRGMYSGEAVVDW